MLDVEFWILDEGNLAFGVLACSAGAILDMGWRPRNPVNPVYPVENGCGLRQGSGARMILKAAMEIAAKRRKSRKNKELCPTERMLGVHPAGECATRHEIDACLLF